ncbi:MAG: hypothetical protein IJ272_07150, partial [Clostridia bacterium]|nr:hypothetical protein [Clostridia bacterium]
DNQVTINETTITASPKVITGYTTEFSNWDTALGIITEARTITANFTSAINSFTVTFEVNDTTLGELSAYTIENIPYGSTITVPEEQFKTATEINGDKYRIFYHDNNWIGVKTDPNAKDEIVNITEENKDNIVMIDSNVNYYAEYTYTDFSTTKSTVKVDEKANITGNAVGISNQEGLVILGQNSTETSNPTVTGDIAIENKNGIVLWYMGDFVGPIKGLVVEK